MPTTGSPTVLVELFVGAMPNTTRVHDVGGLDAVLRERIACASARWPSVDVVDEAFVPYVAARVGPSAWAEDAIESMETDDLFLACGCAAGQPDALRAFELEYVPRLTNGLVRAGFDQGTAADILQALRMRLFIGAAGGLPAIVKYRGQGKLLGWLRVLARREPLAKSTRDRSRELALEDEVATMIGAGVELDFELDAIRIESRDVFVRAFAAAVAGLSAYDRELLRASAVRGLGHGELAARHGVDRTTILRRIRRAEERLRAGMRRWMTQEGQLSVPEYESVMRVLSQRAVELPVDEALASTAECTTFEPEDDRKK